MDIHGHTVQQSKKTNFQTLHLHNVDPFDQPVLKYEIRFDRLNNDNLITEVR